nr:MAG TPA: HNH endonuclease bacteriophage, HNH Endonuclease, DNA.52A [Caudoviricetes sp.]
MNAKQRARKAFSLRHSHATYAHLYIERPLTMLKPCPTPGCPALIPPTTRACPECLKRVRHTTDTKPYTSVGHRKARAKLLALHPYCQCEGCKAHKGLCTQKATVADHFPLERFELIAEGKDPNDTRFMRALCKQCHDIKTAATRPAGAVLQRYQ